MRIGLAFAAEEIIAGMMKVKDSYNLNRLSLIAGVAALEDRAWMERNVARIQRSRRKLARGLKKMGFQVYPSQANFVMARREGENLSGLYKELKRRKILVRYFDLPGLKDSLRITVGTAQEIIAGMMKVKDSYNLNRLSLVAGVAALGDRAWMERNVARIQRSRRKLARGLKKIGFQVCPSQANFVMARREGENLGGLYEELKRRKILVRYFDLPGLKDSLRITVGTAQEVEALLKELESIPKGL